MNTKIYYRAIGHEIHNNKPLIRVGRWCRCRFGAVREAFRFLHDPECIKVIIEVEVEK